MIDIFPIQNGQIIRFTDTTTQAIVAMMQQQHVRLAQLDRPYGSRLLTARNYDSAIKALGDYLTRINEPLPTKSVLTQWRDDMLVGKAEESARVFAIRTINARLSAAGKLLRAIADDVTDITVKLVLQDWSKVDDAKATVVQDKTETDYGRRLTIDSLREVLRSVDTNTLKGLRVSEVVALTLRDVFDTVNETGQRGIRVRKGKHNKSRIVW